MSWLEGQRLIDFAQNTDTAHRTQVAKVLFKAWYIPFYHYGVIHGDPHLGNYTVTSEGTVNLLDFGCVRKFPPRFVKGVIDLYWALQKDDNDLAVHAYEQWGFENLSHELIDVLNLWARFLYAPLLTNSVCALQDINDSAHGRAVAEQVHQELKRLGGVKPPREFVFMDRAAVGVGGALMHLNVEANWHELFHEIIDGFDADTLAHRQQGARQAAGL
jgi:predicted unusual protein kinase regulating ubiquinone biosynthesis (AarF/ABC1/UbiB family)